MCFKQRGNPKHMFQEKQNNVTSLVLSYGSEPEACSRLLVRSLKEIIKC